MSTSTPIAIDTDRPGVPFGRLSKVEIRKMLDTRAGRWLLIVTGLLLALTMGIILLVIGLNEDLTIGAKGFSDAMVIPLSILLPVFAITTVTGEWGQRTHLVSFTLEPRRLRVVAAKLVAVLALALATIVVALIFGALGNLLAASVGGYDPIWNLDVSDLLWTIGLQLAFFAMAFALAMLFLSTPVAVVVFYAVALILPQMVYSILYGVFDWARDLIPWVDMNYAAVPLMTGQGMMGESVDVGALEWVRFVVTLVLWIAVPAAVGLRRIARSEVK
ncbi:ABC transporter permease [Aeromicrobium phragmitis]|uniref:ABC transporter permease n=1 Tax=Aeromicrobium phragmitis TaxID=2478914 RepID=A0A3L8PR92_9ACTN|nr:ABC transporter permease [Aeromicrobium phragmitis]RLV56978.1 ABC transporter permease [Aeromicrobium phragmitis]